MNSWFYTLGPITENDYVYHNLICRRHGMRRTEHEILWQFRDKLAASNAFKQWKQESEAMKPEDVQ
jgi:hypothetical protein